MLFAAPAKRPAIISDQSQPVNKFRRFLTIPQPVRRKSSGLVRTKHPGVFSGIPASVRQAVQIAVPE
jgi:hypothetical protein